MEEMTKVIIYDSCDSDIWNDLQLTESQVRLIKWLKENEFLADEIRVKIIGEFETV